MTKIDDLAEAVHQYKHPTLVTGATGFLGRHVMDRIPRAVGVGASDADLRDRQQVDALFDRVRPERVIHLAAKVGGIGTNAFRPGAFFFDNMLMGCNIIDACRVSGATVTMVGTTCSYPSECPVPFDEVALFDGRPELTNGAYGIAKRALLSMLEAYRQQYGLCWSYPILANLYGPGDNYKEKSSHVIPALIVKVWQAMRNGSAEVRLWGDGTPTRDFLYVEDAADAVVSASHRNFPEPINIGTGIETSIADVARKIASLLGYSGKFVYDSTAPNGQQRRCLNTEAASREWEWCAETTLDDGLGRMVEEWAKSH